MLPTFQMHSNLLTIPPSIPHAGNPRQISSGSSRYEIQKKNCCFDLGNGCILQCKAEVKLLGITIDFKLKFDLNVSNICKKASRQLGILKRIGKNLCTVGKLNIYLSFILSNFSYCPLSWHFCGETNTKKFENFQERALHLIYNDYISDYDTLLLNSKMPT